MLTAQTQHISRACVLTPAFSRAATPPRRAPTKRSAIWRSLSALVLDTCHWGCSSKPLLEISLLHHPLNAPCENTRPANANTCRLTPAQALTISHLWHTQGTRPLALACLSRPPRPTRRASATPPPPLRDGARCRCASRGDGAHDVLGAGELCLPVDEVRDAVRASSRKRSERGSGGRGGGELLGTWPGNKTCFPRRCHGTRASLAARRSRRAHAATRRCCPPLVLGGHAASLPPY
jgi:hypothetical protein